LEKKGTALHHSISSDAAVAFLNRTLEIGNLFVGPKASFSVGWLEAATLLYELLCW